MGYIIGPDGKIVDDGKGLVRPPTAMTVEEMAELFYQPAASINGTPPPPDTLPNPYGNMMDAAASSVTPAGVDASVTKDWRRSPTAGQHTMASPYTGGSSAKIKSKTSGPNGVVRGDSNPYMLDKGGTGQQIVDKSLGMMGQAAGMADESIKQQELSAEQTAEIDKRQLEEEERYFNARQAKELGIADELKNKSAERFRMAQESKQEAIEKVAKWETEMEQAVNTEVDPSRYWNNRSNFQKTMFALGAAAGSLSEHVYGKNTAFDLLQKNILQDINIQQDTKDKKLDFLKDKRANIDFVNNLDRMELADFDQQTMDFIKEYDVRLGAMDKEIDKIIKKYGQERVSPTLLKTKAELLAQRGKVREGLAQVWNQEGVQKRSMEFQAREATKNRAHQMAMQKQSQEFEVALAKQKALDAAKLQEQKGLFNTSKHGGFIVTQSLGADGKLGEVRRGNVQVQEGLEKEFVEQIGKVSTAYVALKTFQDIVNEEGTGWAGVMKSTNRTAALEELVLAKAKATLGGQISDNDINLIRATITGAASGIGEWVKPGDATGVIEKQLANNRAEGTKVMTIYTVPTEDGQAVYDPEGLYMKQGGDEQNTTFDDGLAEWAGKAGSKVTNRATPVETKDPEVQQSISDATNMIDTAFEEGSIEKLEKVAATLRETVNSGDEGTAQKKAAKGKIARRKGKLLPAVDDYSALVAYANEKLDELNNIKAMKEIADEQQQQRQAEGRRSRDSSVNTARNIK